MNQSLSPFSEPAIDAQAPPKPGLGTASVVAICLTLLLMCGGLLTFAYLAIDRLASVIEEIDYGGEYEDDETPVALQYALAEDETVNELVGQIATVEVDSELTYDIKGDNPEYYYTVAGDKGKITVAVWFDEDDESEAWFNRVALVTKGGEVIENLSHQKVPFDSSLSESIWETLNELPQVQERVGGLEHVASNWDADLELRASSDSDAITQFFTLRGSEATTTVKVTYLDYAFDQIESVAFVDDQGIESPIELSGDLPN